MSLTDDQPFELDAYIGQLLDQAVRQRASDIHIEPQPTAEYRLRLRIDGLLRQADAVPPALATRLLVGLKIMAGMDIAERRLPQDGHFTFGAPETGHSCRLATLPTLWGEKLVLRLLQRYSAGLTLEGLGMSDALRRQFLRRLQRPQGLVLLTGPTGSGKTMTLYSAVNALKGEHLNICSVEDPVEIPMPAIIQCQVNRKAQLGFPLLLRALLRQDPDVIMVGEIRDAETAATALHAAQTGHLVLATLHTLTAADTLERLRQLGLDPMQFMPALSMVLAQRLVRRLCPVCRQEITREGRRSARIAGFMPRRRWRATGCQRCDEGYRGRHGMFHLLPATAMPMTPAPDSEPPSHPGGLWQAGLALVESGVTTLEELIRVLGRP
jgi:protein transport protein HofB